MNRSIHCTLEGKIVNGEKLNFTGGIREKYYMIRNLKKKSTGNQGKEKKKEIITITWNCTSALIF